MKIGNGAGARQREERLLSAQIHPLIFVVKFGVCRRRSFRGLKAGWRHVAVVFDGKAELIEDAADARGTQRVRSHQGSELRGSDLDGNAEQGDARLARTSAGSDNCRVGKAKACPPPAERFG